VSGQHVLNIARLIVVLLSMFLMVVAYVVLYEILFDFNRTLALTGLIFFLFFLLFEIGYRSVELVHVVGHLGKQFGVVDATGKLELANQVQSFNRIVSAIYLPLLFSHFLGSIFWLMTTFTIMQHRLLTCAFGLNSVRLLLRLSEYTPFDINIFSGAMYFPPVAVYLILLLVWSWKNLRCDSNIV
jgi:hypothetical protein